MQSTPEGSKTSRIDQITAKGDDPPLPDHGPAEYLFELSNSLGLAREGFSGAVPVSFLEILSWAFLSGLNLTAWESQTLRQMSIAYCIALHSGKDKASFPPWDGAEVKNPVEDVKSAMSVLKKKRGR